MSQIDTLSELLQLSKSNYKVFDLGRKVEKISKSDFERMEQAMLPYPTPLQGHAHLAVVFWQQRPEKPYIWFIKLPLDERGLLNQAARNHFIAIIIEALGNDLTVDPSEKQEELLKGNPYNFTPSQYKLATLNATLTFEFKQPASQYLELCRSYLSGDLGWDNWQGIGVQGLCDFAVRIQDNDNAELLSKALPNLPEQVFTPLSVALENQQLPVALIDKLQQLANTELQNHDIDIAKLSAIIRAMSGNALHPMFLQLTDILLAEKRCQQLELFVAISGRGWMALADYPRMQRFLEAIVEFVDQPTFFAVFQDLVALPMIRPILLQVIRSADRSKALEIAIGELINTMQKQA
ncbi:DUF3549 family protein [Thalassotalea litorea]|uniref:DUF3549 family protein n=1 Tax=Thalassotalea litorea TaxID=2020715 RepID=A0A5R9J058_9GAMM|nr:DUF3549 family protein [Thalassotalea litorea]TLU67548.1 DUF3549 family protein [Thalassotalea litorea]